MIPDPTILVINCGSSSVKFALSLADEPMERLWSGAIERIGLPDGHYFCHHARRHRAGLTAALGGLDRVVFTGGIGANSPEIRSRICDGLAYLGLRLDARRNANHARVISTDASSVPIEAFKADEELIIARQTRDLLRMSFSEAKVRAHG
ncbi:hypothetical protein VSX64_14255 [Aurantimonas sp. C2-6-R+9]|uniref:hypothetical protein n=1 Tax=unclassified Aurantimonas TaxID=2638230 RepID=UPI002E1886CA|nr:MULTISPECIES: hypothetical protein [unclassified Aurantimonas]MEC5292864.1 hypothetical protein [Aurantimonas sp. C2-3-R2]MEC5382032.1 hypothetical protein [Aurantimonas sp. C2-6-R+9]MEC5413928.1 hypothetical protein [Aurantimonas sp. C2-4-R8]